MTTTPAGSTGPEEPARRALPMLPHQAILERALDALTVRQVFGEAYEAGGVTVIPVASVGGGGGGGGGTGQQGGNESSGSGVGFGIAARPAGVYVVRDGKVEWQPAVDVGRIGTVLGLAFFAAASVLGVAFARSRRH